MELFLVALLCGTICAVCASSKNRSGLGWFIIGCLFPLIGVIIILCLGKVEPEKLPDDVMDCPHCGKRIRSIATECCFCRKPIVKPEDDHKTCPFCAETIKKAAIVCKHCGRDLPHEENKPE